MRLIKSILPLVFIFVICISFSCSEDNNPVTPGGIDTTLDSSRFFWKTYIYNDAGFYGGVWAKDTDNVFAVNTSGRYIINMNNGTITQTIFPDFNAFLLTGVDNNTAYIFGTNKQSDSTVLMVKKWNGSSFQDITINNKYSIFPAESYFYKSNEIWLVDSKTRLYKFDGLNIVKYNLILPNDTNCYIQKIYFDSTVQKLRAVLLTNLNPSKQDMEFIYFIYDFNGTIWNKVNEFRVPIYDPNMDYIRPKFINGYILNKTKRDLAIYNNYTFLQFVHTYDFNINLGVAGYSKSNILVEGDQPEIQPANKYYLFHWNGKKWSKEYKETELGGSLVYNINEKYYVVVYNNGFFAETNFIIGVKK
jgi:hypothetical protein